VMNLKMEVKLIQVLKICPYKDWTF
jgi:hypothetical protein